MEKKKYFNILSLILIVLFLLVLSTQIFCVEAEKETRRVTVAIGAGERVERPVNGLDANLQYVLEA